MRTRPRSPAAPGPGPIPTAALRRLDLALARRLEGRLPGERRTPELGEGTELAMVRPYVDGDDIRRLDPNAYARTNEPHVRVHVGERLPTTWIVLDWSPSMAFGTADRRKCDVAEGAAIACGQIATRRGGRLGVLVAGAGARPHAKPRQGRGGLLALMHALSAEPPSEGAGEPSLEETLARLRRLLRTRCAVVVISDFRGDRGWLSPARALAGRHGVLAVEVRDQREDELVSIGDVWLTDPETGRSLRVDTGDAKLRERFAAAAQAERAQLAAELRASGAGHVVLSTKGAWLRELARHLDAQGRR